MSPYLERLSSHEEVSSHSAVWSSCSARMNLHSVESNSHAGGVNSHSDQLTLREREWAFGGNKLSFNERELPFRGSKFTFRRSELTFIWSEILFRGKELPFTGSELPIRGSDLSFSGSELPWNRQWVTIQRERITVEVRELLLSRSDFTDRGRSYLSGGMRHKSVGASAHSFCEWIRISLRYFLGDI